MPYSPALDLLFVHIPKTGGTSIETMMGVPVLDSTLRDETFLYGGYLQHMTLEEILMMKPGLAGSFSFSAVRNPWSRVVSDLMWSVRNSIAIRDMKDYLDKAEESVAKRRFECNDVHFRPQAEFIEYGGRCPAVDFVARFESLEADIGVGLREFFDPPLLPKANVTKYELAGYRDYYTGDLKDRVAKIYQRDIGLFGYCF